MDNKARDVIIEEIKKVGLRNPPSRLKGFLCMVIGFLVGASLAIWDISRLIHFLHSVKSSITIWSLVLIIVCALIIFCIGGRLWGYFDDKIEKVIRENIEKIWEIWEELHHLYFENTPNFFGDNNKLTFEGFTESEIFDKTPSLVFIFNGEKVVFSLSEDVELIEETSQVNGMTIVTKSYYVYFLKYNLQSEASSLEGYDKIEMIQGSLKRPLDGFLSSESIAFNNKYVVQGNNQLQVYKLFTPRVIDAYVDYDDLDTDEITLIDGMAYVDFWDTIGSEVSYSPEIDNLEELINWKKTKVGKSLFNKIKKNFDFYIQAQKDLIPLKIYDK